MHIIEKLFYETKSSYSFDRYGAQEWIRICKHLLNYQSFSFDEAKTYLLSRSMRQAADMTGKATLEGLTKYEGETFRKIS